MPVWSEVLGDLETPVAAFAKLVGDEPGFLLESVEHGERWSRFSFVGRNPSATMVLRDGQLHVDGELPHSVPRDQGILAAIEALLDIYTSPPVAELPPLHGGVMGYLGYDVIREVERLPDVPHDDHGLPDAVMSVIGSLAAFDHWRQRVYLIESVRTHGLTAGELDDAYDAASMRVHASIDRLAQPLPYVPVEPPVAGESLPPVQSSMPDGMYQRAVEVAKEHILDGDIFQVVLAQRYDIELDADPFDVYRVLRQVNPSPYMYFLRHPEITIVGSSPEPMVQLLDRTIISRPIAGTRKRGTNDEHDRKLAAELLEHPKERAEHVMLVDLARNDVGRVADVRHRAPRRADDARALQPRDAPHVAGVGPAPRRPRADRRAAGHAAGRHRERRAEGAGDGDHRRARTGEARAVRRRRRLRRLVGQPRHGDRDPHDVRAPARADGTRIASLQAGAGIVADSVPDDEDLECRNKAAALMAAIPAARRMTAARRAAGTPA